MDVFFVRHGIAVAGGADDAQRPLTPDGIDKTIRIGRAMRLLGCRPVRIATSPLRRAEETAVLLAEALVVAEPPHLLPCLCPGGNFAEFMVWLERQEDESVMVVGHMPDIAEFAQRCLTGKILFSMTFRKAAVCCIAFDEEPAAGRGRLEWLAQPAQLRLLAH